MIGTTRGQRIAAERSGNQYNVQLPWPIDPRLKVGASCFFLCRQILERFHRDKSAKAVADDGHRTFGLHSPQQPCQIVAFGKRAIVFCTSIS